MIDSKDGYIHTAFWDTIDQNLNKNYYVEIKGEKNMVSNNDKRLIQVAMNGWRQFFHYFWRGKWKTAWTMLQESKAQVKEMQKRTMNIAYGEKLKELQKNG